MTTASVLPGTEWDTDRTVGTNVHDLIYRRDRSQKELALALGVTPSVLSKKIRGTAAWSARQVAIAADFLGVEPGRLYQQVTVSKRPPLLALQGGSRAPRTFTQMPLIAAEPTPI